MFQDVFSLRLILTLLSLVLSIATAFYGHRKTRAERQEQEAILQQHADQLRQATWFRVRYASSARFKRSFNFLPWEAAGILALTGQEVTFYRYNASQETKPLVLRANKVAASWVGRQSWLSGGVMWFALAEDDIRHYFAANTGATGLSSEVATRDIYLHVQMALTGISAETEPQPLQGFALEKHPYTIIVLGLLAVIGLYALIDVLVNTEAYAEAPLYRIYIGGGLLMGFATLTWLRLGDIPRLETVALSLLMAVVSGLALYPDMLRFNQLTDPHGLRTYDYRLQDDLSLQPVRAGLPVLTFPHERKYWASLESGSIHALLLRKGGGGFYQIDMAPIYAKTRAFYDK